MRFYAEKNLPEWETKRDKTRKGISFISAIEKRTKEIPSSFFQKIIQKIFEKE